MPPLRCFVLAALLASVACATAASQKISWQQSKGQVNCATDNKYLCGLVQSVHDGDSIRVRPDGAAIAGRDRGSSSVRVRLLQLDAPELRQPHGSESRAALASRLPPGSRVCVTSPGQDRYGRVLGFVCLLGGGSGAGGLDVNAWMLAGGHAWCYLNRCCSGYAAALGAAKSARLGLWAGGDPQPPWLFRRRQRRGRRLRYHAASAAGAAPVSSSSLLRK